MCSQKFGFYGWLTWLLFSFLLCINSAHLKKDFVEDLCNGWSHKTLWIRNSHTGVLTPVLSKLDSRECTIRLKPEPGFSVVLNTYSIHLLPEDELIITDPDEFLVALIGEGYFLDKQKAFSSEGTLLIPYSWNDTQLHGNRMKFQFLFTQMHGKRNNNKQQEQISDEANNGDEIKEDSKGFNKNNKLEGYQHKDAYELFVIIDGDPSAAFDTEEKIWIFTKELGTMDAKHALAAVVGAVSGAVFSVGGVAVAIPALGFGTSGVVAESVAAGIQSMIGNVAAGSIFASLQSAGVLGLATGTKVALGTVGVVAGGAAGVIVIPAIGIGIATLSSSEVASSAAAYVGTATAELAAGTKAVLDAAKALDTSEAASLAAAYVGTAATSLAAGTKTVLETARTLDTSEVTSSVVASVRTATAGLAAGTKAVLEAATALDTSEAASSAAAYVGTAASSLAASTKAALETVKTIDTSGVISSAAASVDTAAARLAAGSKAVLGAATALDTSGSTSSAAAYVGTATARLATGTKAVLEAAGAAAFGSGSVAAASSTAAIGFGKLALGAKSALETAYAAALNTAEVVFKSNAE